MATSTVLYDDSGLTVENVLDDAVVMYFQSVQPELDALALTVFVHLTHTSYVVV
jgi:hypothetical protein